MKLELAETFAVPPDAVFRAATDLDRMGEWMQGLVRIERLTQGPIAVGSRWREVRKMFGKEAAEEFEVTHLEPGRRLDLFVDGKKGASGRGEFRFRHDFLPDGSGTRLVLSGEITGMGCMGAVFGPLMAGMFRKAIRKDLAALKKRVEAGAGSAAR
ncbi:MAG: SRPBCC family protein [Planctomycetales bacterium]|nr:SRPBCC family protein [Planctomycetales bacterium]